MKDEENKLSFLKILLAIIGIFCVLHLVNKGIKVLKNISQISVVEEGSLKFEESSAGYILRDEKVLQGENYKNGMVQIIAEGQRVAKDKPAFRYYSNGEDEILKQMQMLDDEINAAIKGSGLKIWSTDIENLETQIEKVVDTMYRMNELEEMRDKKTELDTYLSKKTKITGNLSPADSHVKSLIEKRNTLEQQLSSEAEVVKSPVAGMVSYRVDGWEEILRSKGFSVFESEITEIIRYQIGLCYSGKYGKRKSGKQF